MKSVKYLTNMIKDDDKLYFRFSGSKLDSLSSIYIYFPSLKYPIPVRKEVSIGFRLEQLLNNGF